MHKLYLLIINCLLVLSSYAQNDYVFRTKSLGYKDGMLGKRIQTITKDSDGIMWFTTLDGLNRYDGYHFQWFTKHNSDLEYGNVREQFNGLFEDVDGYIWIA